MIEIKNLTLKFGDFSLKEINLSIKDGEYFVILGPTGAGKTVLIEYIAGLHRRVIKGEIWIDGRNVTRMAPEEREVGYVPQDYVLFPFLNVTDNIAFGLKAKRFSKADTAKRIESLADLLGISHLLNRDVHFLSGGEKQRVAIARALAPAPRILLLDEPMGALDLQTSKYLQMELQRIHNELKITTLHITHNQTEAEEIADRIAILTNGRLEQVGKPEEVFFYPASEAVSGFIGTPNILECNRCRVLGHGLIEADCSGLRVILPHDSDAVKRIALSPRDIYISDVEPSGSPLNRFIGTITNVKDSGATVSLELSLNSHKLIAEMPRHVVKEMNLEVGKEVFLILKMRRVRVCEDQRTGTSRE